MSDINETKICAVVVTYNRKKFLVECLDSLIKQSKTLDAIILIDNCSTDKTPSYLVEKNILSEEPPETINEPWSKDFVLKKSDRQIKFHYIRMHENTGGSGGFHEGIKTAYENGYDWLWIMDDDVEPLEDGLETMLKFSDFSKCIHPSKDYSDGKKFHWEGSINPSTGFRIQEKEFNGKEEYIEVNAGCFEGMLIHRDIIEKIGYPDKRFFIAGDDTIYGFLASRHTKNIYINKVALIRKLEQMSTKDFLGSKRARLKSDMAFYYETRNFFLIFEYLKKLGTFSNYAYILLFLRLLKSSAGVLVFDGNFKRLKLLYQGFFDGIKGKFGKLEL